MQNITVELKSTGVLFQRVLRMDITGVLPYFCTAANPESTLADMHGPHVTVRARKRLVQPQEKMLPRQFIRSEYGDRTKGRGHPGAAPIGQQRSQTSTSAASSYSKLGLAWLATPSIRKSFMQLSPPPSSLSPPSGLYSAHCLRTQGCPPFFPLPHLTMLDPKWTGTATDRRDMQNLKLEQVVRVGVPIIQSVLPHL
jgi:hypothetical protein